MIFPGASWENSHIVGFEHDPQMHRFRPASRRTLALTGIIIALGLAGPALAQAEAAAAAVKIAAELPSPSEFGLSMEAGDLDQARAWLDGGLPPDFMADRIGSGLMIAAWHGNIPLMELFVARGADVHKTNGWGEQALMHAAWRGQLDAVKWLLAHGAKENRGPLQWSALHYAVYSGRKDVAQLLIERGANIDARSPNGSSVLMMAVYEGHADLAKTLIGLGADRSVKNDWGDGALEWAMKFRHLDIARIVSNADEFAAAANRPKGYWGDGRKSLLASEELERLLRVRQVLETKQMSLARIDRQIATERAQLARDLIAREALPPRSVTLEISASKNRPAEQKARLIQEHPLR
jgi:hypothetical protein